MAHPETDPTSKETIYLDEIESLPQEISGSWKISYFRRPPGIISERLDIFVDPELTDSQGRKLKLDTHPNKKRAFIPVANVPLPNQRWITFEDLGEKIEALGKGEMPKINIRF